MKALIEGGIQSNWPGSFYELMHVEVPVGAGVIYDGCQKYKLYGRIDYNEISEMFKEEDRVVGLFEKVNALIEKASDEKGLMYRINSLKWPDLPRVICLDDGRIYVVDGVSESVIPRVVQRAWYILKNPGRSSQ